MTINHCSLSGAHVTSNWAQQEDSPVSIEAKIFVGNLQFDVDSELFEKAGVVEIAEVIYNRDIDQSRGFGFVTMSTVEEADRAVEQFSRYSLDGRAIRVNVAEERQRRF